MLPALLDQASSGSESGPAPQCTLPRSSCEVAIDFFDASVHGPTHRMRFESLQAQVGRWPSPPSTDPPTSTFKATLKGRRRAAASSIDGSVTIATLDAKLDAAVQGVDLVALQPYLLKVNEAGVRHGTLDLTLAATVTPQLHAPGRVILTGLELASGGGLLSTFAGVPRQAVLAAMQRDGRIEVNFTLDGRLDDPNFSINDSLATSWPAASPKRWA